MLAFGRILFFGLFCLFDLLFVDDYDLPVFAMLFLKLLTAVVFALSAPDLAVFAFRVVRGAAEVLADVTDEFVDILFQLVVENFFDFTAFPVEVHLLETVVAVIVAVSVGNK